MRVEDSLLGFLGSPDLSQAEDELAKFEPQSVDFEVSAAPFGELDFTLALSDLLPIAVRAE